MSVDIILVLYGLRDDLDRCIRSVEEHCEDYTFFIADNNEINLGFTKACNEQIKKGSSPNIWLLNQDAIVLEGAMKGLVERLESNDQVGIAGSMQLDPEDHDIVRHAGCFSAFPSGIHKGGRLSMGHCQIPEKQTWVNGASFMFKRSLIDMIGYMDEAMFLLYSESDFCYRARESGYEVWYEPRSRIIHRLGKASKDSQEWQRKDMLAFMKKWGISALPNGRFQYSRRFQKLDLFP